MASDPLKVAILRPDPDRYGYRTRVVAPTEILRGTSRLLIELALVSPGDRDDAMQEAWLAKLSGRSQTSAVRSFRRREARHRSRDLEGGAA